MLAVLVPTILLLVVAAWLVEPAFAYVDPTAAGHAAQSVYLAAMTAVLAVAAFPRRLAGLASRVRDAVSRSLGHGGASRGSDAHDA